MNTFGHRGHSECIPCLDDVMHITVTPSRNRRITDGQPSSMNNTQRVILDGMVNKAPTRHIPYPGPTQYTVKHTRDPRLVVSARHQLQVTLHRSTSPGTPSQRYSTQNPHRKLPDGRTRDIGGPVCDHFRSGIGPLPVRK